MTDGKDNGFLWAKPCPSIAAVFVAGVFFSPYVRRHCFWVLFPLFSAVASFFLMALSLLQSVNKLCSSTEMVQTSRWPKANVTSERNRNTSLFTLCKVQLARSSFSSCQTDNRLCRACIMVCVACSALAIHIEMLYRSYSALIYVRPRVRCLVRRELFGSDQIRAELVNRKKQRKDSFRKAAAVS